MAEFVEVIKQRNRFCERIKCCDDCKINHCQTFIYENPEKYEKIIMDWAKEHPAVTNADKFKEVFGINPDTSNCPMSLNIEKCMGCDDCEFWDFWEQEYQEPKRDEE